MKAAVIQPARPGGRYFLCPSTSLSPPGLILIHTYQTGHLCVLETPLLCQGHLPLLHSSLLVQMFTVFQRQLRQWAKNSLYTLVLHHKLHSNQIKFSKVTKPHLSLKINLPLFLSVYGISLCLQLYLQRQFCFSFSTAPKCFRSSTFKYIKIFKVSDIKS